MFMELLISINYKVLFGDIIIFIDISNSYVVCLLGNMVL